MERVTKSEKGSHDNPARSLVRKEYAMHHAHQRHWWMIIPAFLLGLWIGFTLGLRLITRMLWRRDDQLFMHQMAQFNKRWTNRAIMPVAGHRSSPYALIEHTGRRSGQPYATPVIAVPVAGGFLIPLVYGEITDWYRNLQATGGGTLQWHGDSYRIGAPERVDGATGLSAFPPFWRWQLGRYGITRFIKVTQVQLPSTDQRQSG